MKLVADENIFGLDAIEGAAFMAQTDPKAQVEVRDRRELVLDAVEPPQKHFP